MANPPIPSPLPELIRPFHGRINNEAPESVLSLGNANWAPLRRTSTATSASALSAVTSYPDSSSSQSSFAPQTEPIVEDTSPSQKPTSFTIHPAKPDHASAIRHIGSTVFAATFGFSIPPADLARYLADSYSLSSIQAELANPNHHFLVAVSTDDQRILGFTQITYHTSEPCLAHLPEESLVELQRLYVIPEAQGLGAGKALLTAAEELAREQARSTLGIAETKPHERTSDEEDSDADDESCEEEPQTRSHRELVMRRKRDRTSSGLSCANGKSKVINMWLGVWEGNFVAQGVYEKAGFERVGDHEFRMGRCVQIDWIMVKQLEL